MTDRRRPEIGTVSFTGWPVEAVEFFERLASDNSKAYWQAHRAVYDECVKTPMLALLADLEPEFGPGRLFRPNRDVRFSADKSPYRLNCAAHIPNGIVSLSAEELFVGRGLYMPDPAQLQRYRAAVAADRSGSELEAVVAHLRTGGFDIVAHDTLKTAPKGFAPDHPRIELLRLKGVAAAKSWPVGPWLGTRKAKERVVTALRAIQPLDDWITRHVG